jgi:hypothetical protein
MLALRVKRDNVGNGLKPIPNSAEEPHLYIYPLVDSAASEAHNLTREKDDLGSKNENDPSSVAPAVTQPSQLFGLGTTMVATEDNDKKLPATSKESDNRFLTFAIARSSVFPPAAAAAALSNIPTTSFEAKQTLKKPSANTSFATLDIDTAQGSNQTDLIQAAVEHPKPTDLSAHILHLRNSTLLSGMKTICPEMPLTVFSCAV